MEFRKRVSTIKRVFCLVAMVILASSVASAQKASVTISLDEAFFDALLNSVFHNFGPPEIAIAQQNDRPISSGNSLGSSFAERPDAACSQTIKILREMNGVRTAVRFRDGKIYVPLAFSGNYNPPFVGCVEFAGWAEANIDLVFDQRGQRLVGNAQVFNFNLNGTGGIGGSLIARMLQTSIDKKLNPIEILTLDKISFGVPVQNSGNLKMRAVGARPVIRSGSVDVQIDYVFSKG
jgi:hypothetical protein